MQINARDGVIQRVVLDLADVDGGIANEIETSVTVQPRLGKLWHLVPGAAPSDEPVMTEMQLEEEPFTLLQWPIAIPDYSETWGPGFSTQLDAGCASQCCKLQRTCTEEFCNASGDPWPCISNYPNLGKATNLLGPSDATEQMLDGITESVVTWVPVDPVGSKAFINLEFHQELYINHIGVYQILSAFRSPGVSKVGAKRSS